jgi:muramoyltetrapeptide carboxypeptidase
MYPEDTVRPQALRPGSRVALVASAGPLAPEAIDRAEERLRALGWLPVTAPHVRHNHFGYLSAPDADRLADLQSALDSEEIDGIWCLRGGYGTMRIMDALDLSPLGERPRPLIGFSDNTVLHLLAARAGVVSFHGPHPAAVELSEFSLNHLLAMVAGDDSVQGTDSFPLPAGAPSPTVLAGGTATGRLVGGNLALLAATIGTRAQMNTEGAILAIEDVGEPLYRIDRMLTQLRCAGVLDGVAGIALGAFSQRPDEGGARLPSLAALFEDRLGDLGVPVVCGLPFGHIPDSWTLPMGARVTLTDAGRLVAE